MAETKITCDALIKRAIEKNCAEPIVQGAEQLGIIINRSDIDFANVTFVEGSPNQIKALPLKTGKKAYPVFQYGKTPFNGLKTTLGVGNLGGYADNEVPFIVPDNGPEVCADIIDPLLDGEFVMIVENKHKNLKSETNAGASAFQIYGFWNGLTLKEGTREQYNDDTLSGWSATLEELKCPKSGMFLNAGSYAATKTLVDTLLVVAE